MSGPGTPNGRYAIAATALWAAWGVSWWAAALWKGRAVAAAAPASYRVPLWTALAGYGGLFLETPAVPRPLWILPSWAGWSLVGAVGAGFGFAGWARLQLGALWSATIVRREGHRLVDSGAYAITRHPIYSGIMLGAWGLAGAKATPLSLAGAALISLGFGLKAKVEERFLARELGEAGYAAYRARVPMLVPLAPR